MLHTADTATRAQPSHASGIRSQRSARTHVGWALLRTSNQSENVHKQGRLVAKLIPEVIIKVSQLGIPHTAG